MQEKSEQEERVGPRRWLYYLLGGWLLGLAVSAGLYFYAEPAAREESAEEAIYFSFASKFTSSYALAGRQRLLQVGISLLLRDEEALQVVERHQPTIRSHLVLLLGEQSFVALQSTGGREALRRRCLEVVQQVVHTELGRPAVEKVLFTDFVLQ